jgi:hypothetical protein
MASEDLLWRACPNQPDGLSNERRSLDVSDLET